MIAFVSTGQPLSIGCQIISPLGLALDVHQDLVAHEILNLYSQVLLAEADSGRADLKLTGHSGA